MALLALQADFVLQYVGLEVKSLTNATEDGEK